MYRVLQPADLAVGSAELEAARRVQQVDDHALGQVGDAVLVDVLVQPRAQGVDLVDVEHDLLLEADLTRREAAGPLRVAAAQHARRVDRAVDVEGRRLTRAKSRHSVAHLRPEEGRRPLGAPSSRGRGRETAGEGGRGRERANDEGERWGAARLEAHQVVELVYVDAVTLVADDVEQEALVLAAPNVGRPRLVVAEPLDEEQHEVEMLLA